MNSQILYFRRTTPQMEKTFNSYMDEAVMLWNEEWTAQIVNEFDALSPVWLAVYPAQKWNELVQSN